MRISANTPLLISFVLFITALSCTQQSTDDSGAYQPITYDESIPAAEEKGLFTLLDPAQTGVTFINPITELEELNILLYEYLYNGGGVAVGDINNDGLMDLYFNGSMEINRLYLNEGNFRFRDITTSAGVDGGLGFKTGVTMVDINGDGLLDIYVCKSMIKDPAYRKNVLYINNGNLTFTERAAEYGLDDASYSSQAYFFDMDGDGDLDLYLLNHPAKITEANNVSVMVNAQGEFETAFSDDLTYYSDRLYENVNGRYVDITKKAGIENEAFGLSVVIADFNNDLRPDIFVCNDYVRPDYLYINNGDKTFKEQFSNYFQHTSFSSMGSDYADINNDGCPELMTADMLPRDHYRQNMLSMIQNFDKFEKMISVGQKAQYVTNTLQLNHCNGTYGDIAFMTNTAYTDWSWAVLFGDYDNDGLKDIFISNGYRRDLTNNDYVRYAMDSLRKELYQNRSTRVDWVNAIPSVKTKSFLFKNHGNLYFSDVSHVWNSGNPAFSNGAAYVDLDNDGWLDIVVNNIDDIAFILRNEGKKTRQHNFIRFIPESTKDRTAYGTRVRIYGSDGHFQDQHFYPTRGFYSSVEPIVHFGIGAATSVPRVEFLWPDGTLQTIENPQINTVHRVAKGAGQKYRHPQPRQLFFEDISQRLPAEAKHKENHYIDFKREPLLHHKLSEEGPALAVGDVNGDGLDDVYLGGAMGQEGKLLVQQRSGSFVRLAVPAFVTDSTFEDVAAVFFDANGNGSPDLYVVSGGNEQALHTPHYQDRLYLNDGKGNFTRATDNLPKQYSSGGCVAVADIDGDGDLDLFVGGRVSPGKYPVPPASLLLRNDGGKFTNVTNEWSEGLITTGMVTDARFADLDKDGSQELIVVGEWMPVTIFKKVNNVYVNATAQFGLTEMTGWWYSLEIADVNNDGYPDIIAGNLGLNSHIQAMPGKPVTMHYKDFDNNGTIDPILCYYNRDVSYPLHFRDRLLDHMIVLKKKFTRYHMYAAATLEDIFTPEQLMDAKVLDAKTFAHTLFLNQGGKGFKAQQLPKYTQISAVRSIRAMDINGNGHVDLVIGGNLYGTDAQLGRYDASVGAILIGDSTGHFEVVGPADSGFSIPGNVRHVVPVRSSSGTHLFVARNNDVSSLFAMKR